MYVTAPLKAEKEVSTKSRLGQIQKGFDKLPSSKQRAVQTNQVGVGELERNGGQRTIPK